MDLQKGAHRLGYGDDITCYLPYVTTIIRLSSRSCSRIPPVLPAAKALPSTARTHPCGARDPPVTPWRPSGASRPRPRTSLSSGRSGAWGARLREGAIGIPDPE